MQNQNTNSQEKRTIISFKDVVLAFFSGGMASVKATNAAPKTLAKALDTLQGMGQDVTELMAYVAEMGGPEVGGHRGRKTPGNGDRRLYKTGKNGVVVSYAHLGVAQGGAVKATFGEDEEGTFIVLRGVAATTAPATIDLD